MDNSDNIKSDRPFIWLYIVPILLLSTGLGAYHLMTDVYWNDEVLSLWLSGGARFGSAPVGDVIFFNLMDTWPPLPNLLLAIWRVFMGGSEFSTRVLALLVGMPAIAIIYRMGSYLISPKTGIIAALMLGTSAFFINYLHEARGHTLYVLLTSTSIYLYWHVLNSKEDKRDKLDNILLVLSIVLMLYTHYLATAVYAFIFVYHILFVDSENTNKKRIFRLLIYSLLLFSPGIAFGLRAAVGESTVSHTMSFFTLSKAIAYGFGNWMPLYFIAAIGYAGWKVRGKHVPYLWLCLIFIFILVLMINQVTVLLFHIRHLILILPLLLIIMASSVAYIYERSPVIGASAIILWVFAGLYSYASPDFMNNQPGHMRNIPYKAMSAIVNTIDECAQEDDTAVFYIYAPEKEFVSYLTLYNYTYHQSLRRTQLVSMGEIPTEDGALPGREVPTLPDEYIARVNIMTDGAPTVWFFVLNDLPRTEQLDIFENLMIENYGYCGQLFDTSTVKGYIFTTDDTLGCQSEHFSVPETILTACTQSIIQTQNE